MTEQQAEQNKPGPHGRQPGEGANDFAPVQSRASGESVA
jgi:hypothetical protein